MEPQTVNESEPDDNASWLRREIAVIVRDKIGMVDCFAVPIADAIVCGLCERMGGREVYIPAPSKIDRDQQIRAMFNGRNLREVMRVFNVSQRTVYRACK